jgi:hypothetical protein
MCHCFRVFGEAVFTAGRLAIVLLAPESRGVCRGFETHRSPIHTERCCTTTAPIEGSIYHDCEAWMLRLLRSAQSQWRVCATRIATPVTYKCTDVCATLSSAGIDHVPIDARPEAMRMIRRFDPFLYECMTDRTPSYSPSRGTELEVLAFGDAKTCAFAVAHIPRNSPAYLRSGYKTLMSDGEEIIVITRCPSGVWGFVTTEEQLLESRLIAAFESQNGRRLPRTFGDHFWLSIGSYCVAPLRFFTLADRGICDDASASTSSTK